MTSFDGYNLNIKVNGTKISSIKHLNGSPGTVTVQLFHKQHENKARAGEDYAHLFCLREGANEMEVSFDLVDSKKVSPFGLTIKVVSPNHLATPILEFKQEEKKSGRFKVSFECYEKMPEGFKTVVPMVD